MSLVIATNNDEDTTMRQNQSIASAYSFRNSLSSVYKIPPNSQVCLQSAKVNLDGRINVTLSNSTYYDWFGAPLLDGLPAQQKGSRDFSTSYPILQQLGEANQVLELTTDEIANLIQTKHKEHHPNRMIVPLKVEVDREANGTGFNGYKLTYTQKPGDGVKRIPSTWKKCGSSKNETRFTWDNAKAMFQRNALDAAAEEYLDPAVGMGINYPIDLSEGKLEVNFAECDKAKADCAWGVGMSRCNLNSRGGSLDRTRPSELFAPSWFSGRTEQGSGDMGPGSRGPGTGAGYYEDFGVHKNADDELVLRHAVNTITITGGIKIKGTGYKEVQYWANDKSHFKALTKRYVFDAADAYTKVRYVAQGEQVEVYLVKDDGTAHLITQFDSGSPGNSYFKPVSQTCWTLHPVLYVGARQNGADEGILAVIDFDGVDITDYDPEGVNLGSGVRGWYEEAQLPSIVVGERINRFCQAVDIRKYMNSGEDVSPLIPYAQKGLDSDNMVDSYISAIITSPNDLYANTPQASSSKLFGFNGRSFVTQAATIDAVSGAQLTVLTSDSASYPVQSIFVRLNGFGQQVLNARTGNKSTILAHLPTADSRGSVETRTRFFYEPNRDIWIDLNNPFELQTTEFGLDFVYSTEQYAKILSGQSIVVLYFREKPKTE
tara:strand:+ start:6215 stop:8191 length:1977 start_codon:yes stop_codon:yes gene_type:complete